jgi:hypothetical protein
MKGQRCGYIKSSHLVCLYMRYLYLTMRVGFDGDVGFDRMERKQRVIWLSKPLCSYCSKFVRDFNTLSVLVPCPACLLVKCRRIRPTLWLADVSGHITPHGTPFSFISLFSRSLSMMSTITNNIIYAKSTYPTNQIIRMGYIKKS